jgi:hypothetical protein
MYSTTNVQDSTHTGYPIRSSPDLRMFAPPQGFSQLTTTFFARRLHRHPPWTLSRLTISFLHPSLSLTGLSITSKGPCQRACLQRRNAGNLQEVSLELWRYGDLNPRPMACKATALAAELYPLDVRTTHWRGRSNEKRGKERKRPIRST